MESFLLHQHILLLETPCPLVRPSRFLRHLTRTISRQQKELPEIRWCQNDRNFEGFLDFPKNMKFWISGFLDFGISGFFSDFWLYLGNEKSYQKSAGVKTTRFFKNMKFLNSGFLDFWISGFFWISGYILATKRATGNPLVSKRPDFRGLFGFSKKLCFGFLDFLIFGFLDFFWIS